MAADDYGDSRPRKGDVTPDSQRAAYEARGGEVTSIGDELDSSYEAGRKAGASDASSASSSSSGPRLRQSGRLSVGAPLAVETIIISTDELVNAHRLPIPSRLLVAFAFYGLLGLASGSAAPAASALGWGVVVATFYAKSNSANKPAALTALDAIGHFFGGSYGDHPPGGPDLPPGAQPPHGPVGPDTITGSSEAGALFQGADQGQQIA